ncbi:MAG: hypothetical protein HC893_10600 [Chloroflexaceae bacterium]|nr:hypothetical protein [Chloroflexaceae bacterium]
MRAACVALASHTLHGYTLYTTAEPCWMCSYAIRETGISLVVIGAETLDVGGISTRYPLLVDATLSVWGRRRLWLVYCATSAPPCASNPLITCNSNGHKQEKGALLFLATPPIRIRPGLVS